MIQTRAIQLAILLVFTGIISEPAFCVAQTGQLTYRHSIKHDSLKKVTSICISPDGKFAYTAAYAAATVAVFGRDIKTGKLRHVQSYEDRDLLDGVVSFRLSPDGKLGVATSFQSNTVALFGRDAKSGKLIMYDLVKNGKRGVSGLKFVIEAVFSPDGKFVYAISDTDAALISIQVIAGKRLKFLKSDKGRDKCFNGARGIAVSPDGKSIYVTSQRANTLTGLTRDPRTGAATIKEVVTLAASGIKALTGIFTPIISPDGRFIYTASGRFRGKTAVSVFKRTDDGSVDYVETLTELSGLDGGNKIIVSKNGSNLYVCGSNSHSIAVLQRDTKTGKLKLIQTVNDETGVPLKSVAGLAVSPDGKFVYAAAEGAMTVSAFERK